MGTIQFICPDAATEPATALTLQALRDEDKIDCPICLFPYEWFLTDEPPNANNSCTNPITLLACNHTFCTACLTGWMRGAPGRAVSCPMCRTHIGNKSDAFLLLQQSNIIFARAMQRMERFRVAYTTAADAVAAAADDNTNNNGAVPPPTLRFRAEQIYSAGGGMLSLMSDAIDNFPPPPPPPPEAGPQQRLLLPMFGSPRFLRFVSALPTAALGVVRRLSDPQQQQQLGDGGLWQVAATATVTQLRRLLLLKLFELYLERYGIDVPGAGELAGGVVSDWQRGMQETLEGMLDSGMPADAALQADRTLLEVDRYVKMAIGAIILVGDEAAPFQAVAGG